MGYDKAKQDFLNFVLAQYVEKGVNELDDTRIKGLLELKYKSLSDAKEVLGDVKSIRESFIGFQKYLYEERVVNSSYDNGFLMVDEPKIGYGKA